MSRAVALARTRTVALLGLEGHLVDVEVHVGTGLPAVVLTGLADASLSEARDRVRAALVNSGCDWPPRRVTINLAPADLHKHGTAYDLAIAAAVITAVDPPRVDRLRDAVLLGELSLDGALRPVRGILPSVLSAARVGVRQVLVPAASAAEAAIVPDVEVVGLRSLRHLVAWLRDDVVLLDQIEAAYDHAGASDALAGGKGGSSASTPARDPAAKDLADVRGQELGRQVLEIAAAGGHHLLLSGPPGAGKTMLAERLPGILPELDHSAALEVTAIRSLAGVLPPGSPLVRRPPYQDPHHSASRAAIVGGGPSSPRPGALSLAHEGVLFLDEAPEFASDVLEALRQPLESGEVVLHRARAVARYPARFQLVLAANPCPCGPPAGRADSCSCSPTALRRYRSRLSGPLLDRVDLQVGLFPLTRADLELGEPGESSARVAERVVAARERMARRLTAVGDGRYRCNGQVPGFVLRRHLPVPSDVAAPALELLRAGRLSGRGVDRVLRVAWTIADLSGRDRPSTDDVAAAATLRLLGQAA